MNVIRKVVVGLAGVVVVALAIELAAPKAVRALVSTLVTVANTSANPVPTMAVDTRNVNVVNTPSVSVSSLPAVQLNGAISATVSNPTDGSGNPIPLVTKDADNAARHPFTATCSANNLHETFGNDVSCTVSVPAGVEYVIQTISISAGTGDANLATTVMNTTTGGVASAVDYPSGLASGTTSFTQNYATTLYADPGSTITIEVSSNNSLGNGTMTIHATIQGYFVSLP